MKIPDKCMNTSGIFITLSQKIIYRIDFRAEGLVTALDLGTWMNQYLRIIFIISSKRNPETAKESTQYQSYSDSKPMWIEIIRRVIYKLLWDFQNTPPRFPHILEVSINSTHSISLFPSNINIWLWLWLSYVAIGGLLVWWIVVNVSYSDEVY